MRSGALCVPLHFCVPKSFEIVWKRCVERGPAFEFDARGVQRLPRQLEPCGQLRCPAVFDEIEEQPRIRPVNLVAHDRMPQPSGMHADLMHPPRKRPHFHQRVAIARIHRRKLRYRRRAVRHHPLTNVDHARPLKPDRLIHRHRLTQGTANNRPIEFPHSPLLGRPLQARPHLFVLGEYHDAAGLAIQPRRHVQRRKTRVFTARSDQARPRPVFRRMTQYEGRFVHHQQPVVFMNDPTGQFFDRNFEPGFSRWHSSF